LESDREDINAQISALTDQLAQASVSPPNSTTPINQAGFKVGDRVKERKGKSPATGHITRVTPCYVYVQLDSSTAQPRRKWNSHWRLVSTPTE